MRKWLQSLSRSGSGLRRISERHRTGGFGLVAMPQFIIHCLPITSRHLLPNKKSSDWE